MVYDAEYYYNHNEDLASWLGFDEVQLFNHFVNHGMAEGRPASENFDLNAYKENNPDLVDGFGGDNVGYYMHYINAGYAEGRIATYVVLDTSEYDLVYDAEYYYNHNEDLASW